MVLLNAVFFLIIFHILYNKYRHLCSYSFKLWNLVAFFSPHLDERVELGGYQTCQLTNPISITYCHINGMLILTRKNIKIQKLKTQSINCNTDSSQCLFSPFASPEHYSVTACLCPDPQGHDKFGCFNLTLSKVLLLYDYHQNPVFS